MPGKNHPQQWIATIALIRQKYTPYGGAERFVAGALEALRAQGHRLFVIARQWQPQEGVQWIPAKPWPLGRLWRDIGFARRACAEVRRRQFDLVQSHERLTCCDIYRAGDGLHREWLRQRRRILSPLRRWFQDWSPFHARLLRAEDRLFQGSRLQVVICNSHMVRREIEAAYGTIPAQIKVIHNAVDTERFSPALREAHRDRLRKEYEIDEDETLFLFVGSGYARKGVSVLLRALAHLPETARLMVIGKDRHAARYQRIAERLGIAARVHFMGAQKEVAPFYGAADALVLPTLYDPFPNVILEAMACGLPVLTSTKCGAIDWLVDGENGLVCDALDLNGVVQRMKFLLDPELRLKFGVAGRNIVVERSQVRLADELLAIYDAILRKRPGAIKNFKE